MSKRALPASSSGHRVAEEPARFANPPPAATVGIRVRMYRVGFGDFFLLTVPGHAGPAHILIDCGVHAANLGNMGDCVKDLIRETHGKLALVILTHYHADHLSGFASNADDFAQCEVGAVWITNRLDPGNAAEAKFQAQLVSVARQLQPQLKLAAAQDDRSAQALDKVLNALGPDENDTGGGSNARALQLLQGGFSNRPPVFYYQAGMEPTLPAELKGVLTAQILAPAPRDQADKFSAADNHAEQYLAAAGDRDDAFVQTQVKPFDRQWPAQASDYPAQAFTDFDGASPAEQARDMEDRLHALQPNALLAAASNLDGTLNNQSLVVLFTCKGKKLLFVGDAQWGNWAYWLYGKPVTGNSPGLLAKAREILAGIDFYKVGHHGSTNANPIPAMAAINTACACMCSTATGAYGKPDKKTEVPRRDLMTSLEQRTRFRLVRSDWIPAGVDVPPDPEARSQLSKLPDGFSLTPGQPYIDFHL
jgi:beta-lactamase superfamily II metal-dependent hydrolase